MTWSLSSFHDFVNSKHVHSDFPQTRRSLLSLTIVTSSLLIPSRRPAPHPHSEDCGGGARLRICQQVTLKWTVELMLWIHMTVLWLHLSLSLCEAVFFSGIESCWSDYRQRTRRPRVHPPPSFFPSLFSPPPTFGVDVKAYDQCRQCLRVNGLLILRRISHKTLFVVCRLPYICFLLLLRTAKIFSKILK